jgi:hypothetical protein
MTSPMTSFWPVGPVTNLTEMQSNGNLPVILVTSW